MSPRNNRSGAPDASCRRRKPGRLVHGAVGLALRAEEIAPIVVSATELSFSLSGGGVAWKGRPLPAVMGVIVKKLGPSTDEQAAVRLLPLMAWERAGVPIVEPAPPSSSGS